MALLKNLDIGSRGQCYKTIFERNLDNLAFLPELKQQD